MIMKKSLLWMFLLTPSLIACGSDEETLPEPSEPIAPIAIPNEAVSFDKKYIAHTTDEYMGVYIPLALAFDDRGGYSTVSYSISRYIWQSQANIIEEEKDLGYGETEIIRCFPYHCFYPDTYHTYTIHNLSLSNSTLFHFYDQNGKLLNQKALNGRRALKKSFHRTPRLI